MRTLFVFVFLSSVAFGQNKFNVEQTNYFSIGSRLVKDSIKNNITGIITCKFGDIGECLNGIKIGIHKTWHSNGVQASQTSYNNRGLKQGDQKRYDRNGQIQFEARFNAGQPDTIVRWYYDGKIEREENCNINKLGNCYKKQWYPNGQLGREQLFEWVGARTKKISEKCWDEIGNQIDCSNYDD